MNNPLKYIDPSGHVNVCGASGDDCENDRDAMVEIYYESEAESPLVYPIVVDDRIIGRKYYMPQGSAQSTRDHNSLLYKGGRGLAAAGICLDVVELILTTIPGASAAPGYVDGGATYIAGMFTGDNYFPFLGISNSPEGLPEDMYSINQDTLVNMGEAFVPIVAAPILGASGVVGSVTPIPGDELSLIAYQLVDAGTSLGSALYDAGRFTGDFPNHYTLGIAGGEIIIVYWP